MTRNRCNYVPATLGRKLETDHAYLALQFYPLYPSLLSSQQSKCPYSAQLSVSPLPADGTLSQPYYWPFEPLHTPATGFHCHEGKRNVMLPHTQRPHRDAGLTPRAHT